MARRHDDLRRLGRPDLWRGGLEILRLGRLDVRRGRVEILFVLDKGCFVLAFVAQVVDRDAHSRQGFPDPPPHGGEWC